MMEGEIEQGLGEAWASHALCTSVFKFNRPLVQSGHLVRIRNSLTSGLSGT